MIIKTYVTTWIRDGILLIKCSNGQQEVVHLAYVAVLPEFLGMYLDPDVGDIIELENGVYAEYNEGYFSFAVEDQEDEIDRWYMTWEEYIQLKEVFK